jgi:hypothetical protein
VKANYVLFFSRFNKAPITHLKSAISLMGKRREACRIFAGKPERKRKVATQSRKWMDNIKTDLRAMEMGVID